MVRDALASLVLLTMRREAGVMGPRFRGDDHYFLENTPTSSTCGE